MQCDEQDVLLLRDLQQRGANHQIGVKTKAARDLLIAITADLRGALFRHAVTEILEFELQLRGRQNALRGAATIVDKHGAQSFMSLHDRAQSLLERAEVDTAG